MAKQPTVVDQRLLALGEVLADLGRQLQTGDASGMSDAERDRLTTEWQGTLEAIATVPALSRAGRRVKAAALLLLVGQSELHPLLMRVVLSVVKDILR